MCQAHQKMAASNNNGVRLFYQKLSIYLSTRQHGAALLACAMVWFRDTGLRLLLIYCSRVGASAGDRDQHYRSCVAECSSAERCAAWRPGVSLWMLGWSCEHDSMDKVPPWQCSSSAPAHAWRLWAARHSQEEAGTLGAQTLPQMLEPAASKAAVFTAVDHVGTTAGTAACGRPPTPAPRRVAGRCSIMASGPSCACSVCRSRCRLSSPL